MLILKYFMGTTQVSATVTTQNILFPLAIRPIAIFGLYRGTMQ